MIKDAPPLLEISTSSEPKYSLGKHAELLPSLRFGSLQKEIFKERTGKSAMYDDILTFTFW